MAAKIPTDTVYTPIDGKYHNKIRYYEDGTKKTTKELHVDGGVAPNEPTFVHICKYCNYKFDIRDVSATGSTTKDGVEINLSTPAPFNDYSKKIANNQPGKVIGYRSLRFELPKDNIGNLGVVNNFKFYDLKMITATGITGTKLTALNPYYRNKSSSNPAGKVSGGWAPSHLGNEWNLAGYGNKTGLLISNCVGVRGRFQELIGYIGSKTSFPSTYAKFYAPRTTYIKTSGTAPFTAAHEISDKPKDGFIKAADGFYIWQDKAGTYGIKNGCWGWKSAAKGGIPVPGAMVIWVKRNGADGHIEFIDAVYDRSSPQCYIITHASASGEAHKYLDNWHLRMGVRHKIRPGKASTSASAVHQAWMDEKTNWWAYGGKGNDGSSYRDTIFLYTPLCMYGGVGAGSGISPIEPGGYNICDSEGYEPGIMPWFDTIEVNYDDPPEQQIEAYKKIQDYLDRQEKGKVKGAKVRLTWIGNTKPGGNGKKINRNGGEGYIKSVNKSAAYPYEVADSKGSRIGYFLDKGIKVI